MGLLPPKLIRLLTEIHNSENGEFNTAELNKVIKYQREQDLKQVISRARRNGLITTMNFLRRSNPETNLIAYLTKKGYEQLKRANPMIKRHTAP